MNRVSSICGAIDVGGGGRVGSTIGGRAAIGPAIPLPMEALRNRPKSSAGHVVNCPATRVSSVSTAAQRRNRRTRLLTIDARCSVMSPDCIQNVDKSQLQEEFPGLFSLPPKQTARSLDHRYRTFEPPHRPSAATPSRRQTRSTQELNQS